VHFAGHAVMDDARPEQSGLVLAGAAGATAPLLRASEVAALPLGGVRLVVLSACDTWRAPGSDGGGYLSLADAFLRAGAHGVVASFWRVDDGATLALMRALHLELARGTPPAAALRAAQLQLLANNDVALRSPAAWAGFAFTGR
jgi:CHAT domain-containing protein